MPTHFFAADICEQFYSVQADAILVVPVFVAFVPSHAVVTLNEEHSAYRWMGLNEALAVLPFAGQRKVLKEVWTDFVERAPNEHLRIEIGA